MAKTSHEELLAVAWPEVGSRLLRAGVAMARDTGALHRYLQPEDVVDLVNEVVADVCSDQVKWDPSRGDLYPFLKVVVARRIADRGRKRNPQHLEIAAHESDASSASPVSSTEDDLVSVENDAEVAQRIDEVFQLCENDQEAQAVVEAIMGPDGDHRPRILAKLTGFAVGKVNTILARIRRRAFSSTRQQLDRRSTR
jgi:DNA-directed RNA polymerase specialized sigma24 family protein